MITFWNRFLPHLYVAGVVVGLIWWSSTLPSHYTAAEVQGSARFMMTLLGGYLAMAAVVCAANQAAYEQRVHQIMRAQGYVVNDNLTISGVITILVILVGIFYVATYIRDTDSKITGPSKSTKAAISSGKTQGR